MPKNFKNEVKIHKVVMLASKEMFKFLNEAKEFTSAVEYVRFLVHREMMNQKSGQRSPSN